MKKLFTFSFLMISALFVFSACSKKQIKPVPQDVTLSQQAFSVLDQVRKAYLEKNDQALKNLTTEEGYSELQKETKPFDSAQLTFDPRWVEMKGETVTVNVEWNGTWVKAGKKTSDRGMAIFELNDRPLKLNRILKGSPFKDPQ